MAPSLRLDEAGEEEARARLWRCCGSSRWVDRMLARRPFRSLEALLRAAREEWFGLEEADWREAFTHHPMIGDREALRARFAPTWELSTREQAGVAGASEEILDALARGNRDYFDRFGYIFIVCATGLGAAEMLQILRGRMANDPSVEIGIAAAEHARITELRLRALASRGP